MTYVSRVLQPGEAIVHATRMHPIIFLPAVLWLAAAVALFFVALSFTGDLHIGAEALAAAAAALFGIFSGLPALIRWLTTELAVTDRRVIYKAGFVSRHTLEMNRSKVESVDVDQTLLGRLLGFGTVMVRGTGGSFEPIPFIGDPLTFRSHITGRLSWPAKAGLSFRAPRSGEPGTYAPGRFQFYVIPAKADLLLHARTADNCVPAFAGMRRTERAW